MIQSDVSVIHQRPGCLELILHCQALPVLWVSCFGLLRFHDGLGLQISKYCRLPDILSSHQNFKSMFRAVLMTEAIHMGWSCRNSSKLVFGCLVAKIAGYGSWRPAVPGKSISQAGATQSKARIPGIMR